MQKELAEIIAEISEGTVYENYSGRGMFGKNTYGVVVEGDMGILIADVIANAEKFVDWDAEQSMFDNVQSIRSDSLGLDMIYY